MLQLTAEQSQLIDDYQAERKKSKKDAGSLVLPLDTEQESRVWELLLPIVSAWDPVYSNFFSRMAQYVAGKFDGASDVARGYTAALPDKDKDKSLFERDLSQEERLAVFLAFHSGKPDLRQKANSVLTYIFFFMILGWVEGAWPASGLNNALTTQAPSGMTGQDAFNEAVGVYLSEEYEKYDIRQGTQVTTFLTKALKGRIDDMPRDKRAISRDMQKELKNIYVVERELRESNELSGEPTAEDIARYYKVKFPEASAVSAARVQRLKKLTLYSEVSIDKTVDSDDEDSETEYGDAITYRKTISEDYQNPLDLLLEDEALKERWEDFKRTLSITYGRRRAAQIVECIQEAVENVDQASATKRVTVQDLIVEKAAEGLSLETRETVETSHSIINNSLQILRRTRGRKPVAQQLDVLVDSVDNIPVGLNDISDLLGDMADQFSENGANIIDWGSTTIGELPSLDEIGFFKFDEDDPL